MPTPAPNQTNIAGELQALPLEYMLSGPLVAVIKAQSLAAKTTLDFIQTIGLEDDPNDPNVSRARTAEFSYSQSVPDPANPGGSIYTDAKLAVPLLSIVPIPYIRASDLNVSFEFKIRDVQSAQSKSEITGSSGFSSSTTTTANGSFGKGLLGFLGGPSGSGSLEQKTNMTFNVSATYQATNRHTTDRSATFKMTMNAVQDSIPEGLARVLSILSDAIKAPKK